MTDRYANIPISKKTRAGMSLNIDDLGAISRLLSLQDDVYDEQFEKLFKLLDTQSIAIMSIVETLKEVKADLELLKTQVKDTQTELNDLIIRVDVLEADLDGIKDKLGININK